MVVFLITTLLWSASSLFVVVTNKLLSLSAKSIDDLIMRNI